MTRLITFSIVLVLVVSCNRYGIVDGVKVDLVTPEKVVSISPDTNFRHNFLEVLHCFQLQIVCDTILVVQEHISETTNSHFKAYSINSADYLGSFIQNGRGPGELIGPRIVQCCPNEKYLNLSCHQMNQAYIIDVIQSIKSGMPAIVQNYTLQTNQLDWHPLPDSASFVFQFDSNLFSFNKIGIDEEITNTTYLSKDINAEHCIIHLSSFMIGHDKTDEIANVMIFSPHIDVIDMSNGQLRSFATDRDYRKWKSQLHRIPDMNTMQYYMAATASPDYIFAVYKKVPLSELHASGHDTSIHVFDWNGNFLYNISVSENIGAIAFDRINRHLYGSDESDCRIIRYDLSQLLPHSEDASTPR